MFLITLSLETVSPFRRTQDDVNTVTYGFVSVPPNRSNELPDLLALFIIVGIPSGTFKDRPVVIQPSDISPTNSCPLGPFAATITGIGSSMLKKSSRPEFSLLWINLIHLSRSPSLNKTSFPANKSFN